MPPYTKRVARLLVLTGFLSGTSAIASGQAAKQQPPVLTAFSINAGADSVASSDVTIALAHTVVGARPTEYRVSHRADFAGAHWLPYSASLMIRDWYEASGTACAASHPSHRVTLYFQVRANVGEQLRIVDGQRQLVPASVESNVLRAAICAHVLSATPRGMD